MDNNPYLAVKKIKTSTQVENKLVFKPVTMEILKTEMKTLVFAPETINIAETTRMVEIAKAVREHFHCIFFGYSDKFSHLITEAGFEFKRMEPWLTAPLSWRPESSTGVQATRTT